MSSAVLGPGEGLSQLALRVLGDWRRWVELRPGPNERTYAEIYTPDPNATIWRTLLPTGTTVYWGKQSFTPTRKPNQPVFPGKDGDNTLLIFGAVGLALIAILFLGKRGKRR